MAAARRVCGWTVGCMAIVAWATGAASATAQSRWGVAATFTPKWTEFEQIRKAVIDSDGAFEGSQLTLGLVRGSTRGGDWGVHFVRQRLDDTTSTEIGACEPQPCQGATTTTRWLGVAMRGVEFTYSPSLVTAGRVQVGVTVGGGIASISGQVEETTVLPDIVIPRPNAAPLVFAGQVIGPDVLPVQDSAAYPYLPLVRAEIHGNVLVAPGLKLRVAGGLNGIGVGARVGLVYLFGAR